MRVTATFLPQAVESLAFRINLRYAGRIMHVVACPNVNSEHVIIPSKHRVKPVATVSAFQAPDDKACSIPRPPFIRSHGASNI